MEETEFYIDKGAYEGTISFDTGIIDFSTYSYEIGSWGHVELTDEETRTLYLVMKDYYERKDK
jgi:hypothetical protein